jgi:hypothetical protein
MAEKKKEKNSDAWLDGLQLEGGGVEPIHIRISASGKDGGT